MKARRLSLFCFILLCVLALAGRVQAALLALETPLTQTGSALELNLDSQGVLWVSDGDAGEIRAVDTVNGTYTIYPVGGSPSDAHGDGAGTVWWLDNNSNQIGHLTTSNNVTATWEIPNSLGLWGIALGQNGQVWASDGSDPSLYRLGPPDLSNNLQWCTYALPDSGVGEYLAADQGRVWLGDSVNGRIVRLDGATFTWWNVPGGGQPRDLVLDGSGRVWWTDASKGYVGRLNPVANSITIYTPPASGTPQMLTVLDGKVWYTQQGPGRVVNLDPALASGTTTPATHSSATATMSCGPLQPQASVHITPISGQVSLKPVVPYPTLIEQAGWSIYAMPAGANPYGIAAVQQIWLVDNGRQVLARVSPSSSLYLPVIINSH